MRWERADAHESWSLEIGHDRFEPDGPLDVVLVAEEGTGESALIWATPEQAREMAKALETYADMVDKQNA